jgi:hypothetical protein
MNWACVMVGGPTLLATLYYIVWGRKSYTPPSETVEDYLERYHATVEAAEKEMSTGVAEDGAGDEMVTEESVDAAEKRD